VQARETPCRSALSVGGIIKHAAYVMRGALERLRTEAPSSRSMRRRTPRSPTAVVQHRTHPGPARPALTRRVRSGLACSPRRSPGS
jgi:hypothetical protein